MTETLPPPPPLGLRPRWIAEEARLEEIDNAILRYISSRYPLPREWLDERDDLLARRHPESS